MCVCVFSLYLWIFSSWNFYDCFKICLYISRWFGGLLLDIKRKTPHYLSDYTDAFSLQCVASFLFLYCACMSPVITFGGLLGEATEGRIVNPFPLYSECSQCSAETGHAVCTAANLRPDNSSAMVRISLINHPSIIFPSPFPQSAIESLFGASLTGIAYSLFAGQPLTILGSTGPVLVFEKILFKFCKYAIFFLHLTVHVNHLQLPVYLIYT